MRKWMVALFIFSVNLPVWSAIFYSNNVPLYAIWQKSVQNTKTYSNKFNYSEIELRGTFTSPSNRTIQFIGFFAGNGSGGQSGNVWKIRFMPTETGTWQYSLSFSDGTAIPGASGSFTVIPSDLPGPVQLYSRDDRFLADASDTPIKWKSYMIGFAEYYPRDVLKQDYYQVAQYLESVIDNHMIPQGYNATMIESPIYSSYLQRSSLFYSSDLKTMHVKSCDALDNLIAKMAESRIWCINWVAFVHQNQWGNFKSNMQNIIRYFVARWAPFYNYFGWSPTWETWEVSGADADNGPVEQMAKLINQLSPWEKFPTTHDRAKSYWTDWQRIQLRQCQSRTVTAGNNRTADGFSGFKYPIIGSEDNWEYCSGYVGQPRNGTEVRRGVWGELLAGVYTMYSEWYHVKTANGPCDGNGNGEGDPFNRIAMDFWYDNTQWYKYQMKNGLVNDGSNCRASGWTNNEYVVYDQNGGSNSINLAEASGTFKLTWLNPLTGATVDGGTVNGGGSAALNPPGSMASEWCAFIHKPSDTIPPNTPTGLIRQGATGNCITLAWTAPAPAPDGDGAWGYVIKRDNSQVGTSQNPVFTDCGLTENTSYEYEVYSRDDAGNLSLAAATGTFSTAADTTPPALSSVSAPGPAQVKVTFSEPVEQASADNAANYTIDNGVQVLSAKLEAGQDWVTLVTSALTEGITYTLTVSNVRDRAQAQNSMTGDSRTFIYVSTMEITNLNRTNYQVSAGVNIGDPVYIDRNYTYSQFWAGYDQDDFQAIRTANDDKASTGTAFLTFDVNAVCTVFVCYAATTPPSWMSGWQNTGRTVVTSDRTLYVFSKIFMPGSISLGGNESAPSMYTVFITRLFDTVSIEDKAGLPRHCLNMQFYPNPFNTWTNIFLTAGRSQRVCVKIFDIKGRLVHTLINSRIPAGAYTFAWTGPRAGSAIYFIRLETQNRTMIKPLQVIK
jgi:chitodextrinase